MKHVDLTDDQIDMLELRAEDLAKELCEREKVTFDELMIWPRTAYVDQKGRYEVFVSFYYVINHFGEGSAGRLTFDLEHGVPRNIELRATILD